MKDIKLSTEVALDAPEWKVDHQTKILTIGSCFAEVLGGKPVQGHGSGMPATG